MNVVGKVGSLITQGVYSVATPFHPFGGAVDIIVVQQQDGTFRSTPWYVRFGKFQGVLKGAEKIVRITVNGIEADFHMYLDNSGEAYFLREVDSGKGSVTEGVIKDSDGNESTQEDNRINHDNYNAVNFQRLDHCVSDSGVAQLRGECDSLGVKRLERAESDCVRFYEFSDEQSSLEGSVELSEYSSNRYENLNNDHAVESQILDSEVVLVSVDGHILTAPILASEQNTEDLQLSTPQFHLGPGEGTEFCNDGNDDFDSGEGAWAADYISKLNTSKSSDASDNMSGDKNVNNVCMHEVEYCDVKGEHVSQAIEIPSNAAHEGNFKVHNDLENIDASDNISGLKNDDKACVHDQKSYKGKSKHVSQASQSPSNGAHAGNTMVHNELEAGHASNNIYGNKNDGNACVLEPENCEGESKYISQAIEGPSNSQAIGSPSKSQAIESPRNTAHEGYTKVYIVSEDLQEIKKRDIFKSCLELTELEKHGKGAFWEDLNSSVEHQPSLDNFDYSLPTANANKDTGAVELRNPDYSSLLCSSNLPNDEVSLDLRIGNEAVENNVLRPEILFGDGISVHSVNNDKPDFKDEHFGTSATADAIGTMAQSVAEDECSRSVVMKPLMATSTVAVQTQPSVEISLCRNKLRPAMGLDAAAEAFDTHRVSPEKFISNAGLIMKNDNLIVRFRGKYLPWEKAAPVLLGLAAFGLDLPIEPKDAISVEHDDTPKSGYDDSGMASTPGRRWRLWPIPFRRVKTLEHSSSTSSNEEEFVDSESVLNNSHLETSPISHSSNESPRKQLIRTNVPSTDQIASMNLKEGQNMITFSFSTRVLGKQQVDAHIYLWKWNAKIVISDVDGTITKSDVLGQFMPLVGKDWTQSGVAKLFCAIKENGYQLLFLSARAIVQAYLTRSFLLNLKQDGKTLPSGPVVMSPDGLFPSLIREVIRRAPHEFKIACLEDIKKLFPPDYNPFYAGFGNRDTDELSYRKIGIPKGKIFIINPKGEVAISHRIDVKSYTNLHTLVNDMFPPTSLVEQEDFNSWNFWRVPLPEVEL